MSWKNFPKFFGFELNSAYNSLYTIVMDDTMIIQGLRLSREAISLVGHLIQQHPSWNRTRLSKELCKLWNWRNACGDLKDMACRTLLLKLEKQGQLSLPPPRNRPPQLRSRRLPDMLHSTDPITDDLTSVMPISLFDARQDRYHHDLFNYFLHHYHYLGFKTIVGENLKYIAFDCHQRPLACLLFGAPAWKLKHRDLFIGWIPTYQKQNLNLITNNTRFLILPWVQVKNLASHLLSRAASQLNDQWSQRYSHEIFMLETFVDTSRLQDVA